MRNKQLTEAVTRRLGDKPSIALRQALEDLEAVEKCGDYAVNMDVYHMRQTKDTPCQVCLAGAVLAQAGLSKDVSYTSDMVDYDTWYKLTAIDVFRKGYVSFGLHLWHVDDSKWLTSPEIIINVPRFYSDSDGDDMRNAFKDGIRRVIAKLEELGE